MKRPGIRPRGTKPGALRSRFKGTGWLLVSLLGPAVLAACAGGGGSSTAAPSGPPLGGIGPTFSFDQRVNFTVIVPPPTTTAAVAAARRRHLASTTLTNPYVSPNTGSVSLQIVTVNSQSPQTLPAPVKVNVACAGNTGCSVPIQNVPAVKGVDRFSVDTFAGPNGTGNLISAGFIDVTVPSAQATSFGGTALTIGGYVQSISLAVNEPARGFTWNSPATGTIDVNAIDPAGAIIIGSDQLANAIQVSLPNTNGSAFTVNGMQQVTLQTPAQTLTLAYDGAVLNGGSVNASTIDENSQPVATSIPIPVQAPPTPKPSPVPSMKPPLSLYVYDAAADRILEYSGVNAVEGGQQFDPQPRRIFEVAPPPALLSNLAFGCNSFPLQQPFLADMTVGPDGTIYTQTTCQDAATGFQSYNLAYAPSTQEIVPPQASPTPPVPISTFSVTTALYAAQQLGIRLDEAHNTIYLQYANNAFTSVQIIGVPLSNLGGAPTTNFGATCLQELGFSAPADACTTNLSYNYAGPPPNFALDGLGNVYVPLEYGASDNNGNPITPPGDSSQAFQGEPTVSLFTTGSMNPAPTPLSAFAGLSDELGASPAAPPQVAFDGASASGSTLYVLAQPGPLGLPISGNLVYAGLSGCPPPSTNAIPDTPTTNCENQAGVEYIAGFANATQTISLASNLGTNVVSPPKFMVGGDVVGGFGIPNTVPGDQFAIRDGFAFVLNVTPPPAFTGPAEIDVYNLNAFNDNSVSEFSTATTPVAKLLLDPSIQASSIAVGPTGTATGGQALLRRPARVHHDLKAWARDLQRRRLELMQSRKH